MRNYDGTTDPDNIHLANHFMIEIEDSADPMFYGIEGCRPFVEYVLACKEFLQMGQMKSASRYYGGKFYRCLCGRMMTDEYCDISFSEILYNMMEYSMNQYDICTIQDEYVQLIIPLSRTKPWRSYNWSVNDRYTERTGRPNTIFNPLQDPNKIFYIGTYQSDETYIVMRKTQRCYVILPVNLMYLDCSYENSIAAYDKYVSVYDFPGLGEFE